MTFSGKFILQRAGRGIILGLLLLFVIWCDILTIVLLENSGQPSDQGGSFFAPGKGVLLMLTYSELFQFCMVIIGIISLFIQAKKK